jgi:hypothetical protein
LALAKLTLKYFTTCDIPLRAIYKKPVFPGSFANLLVFFEDALAMVLSIAPLAVILLVLGLEGSLAVELNLGVETALIGSFFCCEFADVNQVFLEQGLQHRATWQSQNALSMLLPMLEVASVMGPIFQLQTAVPMHLEIKQLASILLPVWVEYVSLRGLPPTKFAFVYSAVFSLQHSDSLISTLQIKPASILIT